MGRKFSLYFRYEVKAEEEIVLSYVNDEGLIGLCILTTTGQHSNVSFLTVTEEYFKNYVKPHKLLETELEIRNALDRIAWYVRVLGGIHQQSKNYFDALLR